MHHIKSNGTLTEELIDTIVETVDLKGSLGSELSRIMPSDVRTKIEEVWM